MSSMLEYLTSQTQQANAEAERAIQERQLQRELNARSTWDRHRQLTGDASMSGGGSASLPAADPRSQSSLAEAAGYSEAKLREQQGYGVAETGDAYSDARLRDQLGLPLKGTKPALPLENYLGAANSPESYRTGMMQYVASGGQKPRWYTGDYATDKPNIEAAVSASMTPQQQLVRREAQQRIDEGKTRQEALEEYRKETLRQREREQAARRDKATPAKIVPARQQLEAAEDVIAERLGEDALRELSLGERTAAAREIASKAKLKMETGETGGADYDALVAAEVDQLIAEGRLKPGKEGWSWFNIGAEKPTFTPRAPVPGERTEAPGQKTKSGTYSAQQEDWISRATKANPGMSREQIIEAGKGKGKL